MNKCARRGAAPGCLPSSFILAPSSLASEPLEAPAAAVRAALGVALAEALEVARLLLARDALAGAVAAGLGDVAPRLLRLVDPLIRRGGAGVVRVVVRVHPPHRHDHVVADAAVLEVALLLLGQLE